MNRANDRFAIRHGDRADAKILGKFRAEMRRELHPEASPAVLAAFERECEEYFDRELRREDPSVRARLAESEFETIGTIVLLTFPTLPRLESPGRHVDARIRDVYVLPQWRRRGIATALLQTAIDEARDLNVSRLTLAATEQGVALYEKLGFEAMPNEYVYRL